MKKLIFLFAIALAACSGNSKSQQQAENALDAGREFISACLQGDFSKASYLMVQNPANIDKLKKIEASYRQKDKEGRQQYRTASININEITELNESSALIKYSNSFDKTPESILVTKQPDGWKVDITSDKKPG